MSRLSELWSDRPLHIVASTFIILMGAGASLLSLLGGEVIDVISGVVAATAGGIGGALLSNSLSETRPRERAVELFKAELQMITRHVSDAAMKLNRIVQMSQNGEIDTEAAIDRVSQVISIVHGAVNDLNLLVGSPSNFQTIIDTVSSLDSVSTELETMMNKGGGKSLETEPLREKLESARLQLGSAKRALGDIEAPRAQERVLCPNCSSQINVWIGKQMGDSALPTCSSCGSRFHVHRTEDGIITRPWGVYSRRVDAVCPNCSKPMRLLIDNNKNTERRFCLSCDSDLEITTDGSVVDCVSGHAVDSTIVEDQGDHQILKCPKCGNTWVTFWGQGDLVKAVCKVCWLLLKARIPYSDRSTIEPRS
ncbi:MAG: hypothetical protein IT585_06610 [candidate division Zixibacteria bacterium]|nr:hypothetical protein [candidate division Zixibacteria bacterium]